MADICDVQRVKNECKRINSDKYPLKVVNNVSWCFRKTA